MQLSRSSTVRWAWVGAAFGACFPLGAVALRWAQGGVDGAREAVIGDPLLWIIFTAPVFLGVFALVGGRQHDRATDLSRDLERRVEARTAELSSALGRIRLLLDSTADALIAVTPDGRVEGAPSRAALGWFGPPADRASAWLFGSTDAAVVFDLLLPEIVEDVMPFELLADQLPQRIERNGSAWALTYRRIDAADGALLALLLVVRDVTAEEAARRADAERAEQQVVIASALADTATFGRTLQELRALVGRVASGSSPLERARTLHTLKGSAAVAGFASVARAVHDVEDELALGRTWSERLEERVGVAWARAEGWLRPFAHLFEGGKLDVRDTDLRRLEDQLASGDSSPRVRELVAAWRRPRLEPMLRRLAEHAERVALRLGRSVEPVIRCDADVRVADEQLEVLWGALVHVVRNAVDHGLEAPEDRVGSGKPPTGSLRIEAWESRTHTWITVRDDGRGIDWERVREKGKKAGLRVSTDEDLRRALFADGFTTRDEVTELSGRGVGLSAVRSACDASGVTLELASDRGVGTVWSFGVPAVGVEHVAEHCPSGPMPALAAG
jgi:two-component system chemotaxis sensor kinase CheA